MTQRHLDEQSFFDKHVEAMGVSHSSQPLLIDPDGFLKDETYRYYAFEALGDVRGRDSIAGAAPARRPSFSPCVARGLRLSTFLHSNSV